MLIGPITADERLTTTHRAKLAYVYVRQSSLNRFGSIRRVLSCNTASSIAPLAWDGAGTAISTTVSSGGTELSHPAARLPAPSSPPVRRPCCGAAGRAAPTS